MTSGLDLFDSTRTIGTRSRDRGVPVPDFVFGMSSISTAHVIDSLAQNGALLLGVLVDLLLLLLLSSIKHSALSLPRDGKCEDVPGCKIEIGKGGREGRTRRGMSERRR